MLEHGQIHVQVFAWARDWTKVVGELNRVSNFGRHCRTPWSTEIPSTSLAVKRTGNICWVTWIQTDLGLLSFSWAFVLPLGFWAGWAIELHWFGLVWPGSLGKWSCSQEISQTPLQMHTWQHWGAIYDTLISQPPQLEPTHAPFPYYTWPSYRQYTSPLFFRSAVWTFM